MVAVVFHFDCEKCRRRYFSDWEARQCEIDHIAADAIARFKDDLARIFSKKEDANQ